MSRQDKERVMMEDRGWEFDDDEPALKYDSRGTEVGREGDAIWNADLEEVRSLL